MGEHDGDPLGMVGYVTVSVIPAPGPYTSRQALLPRDKAVPVRESDREGLEDTDVICHDFGHLRLGWFVDSATLPKLRPLEIEGPPPPVLARSSRSVIRRARSPSTGRFGNPKPLPQLARPVSTGRVV